MSSYRIPEAWRSEVDWKDSTLQPAKRRTLMRRLRLRNRLKNDESPLRNRLISGTTSTPNDCADSSVQRKAKMLVRHVVCSLVLFFRFIAFHSIAANLESVPVNRQTYMKEIKPILERSFKTQEFFHSFVVNDCCFLRNKRHEHQVKTFVLLPRCHTLSKLLVESFSTLRRKRSFDKTRIPQRSCKKWMITSGLCLQRTRTRFWNGARKDFVSETRRSRTSGRAALESAFRSSWIWFVQPRRCLRRVGSASSSISR